MRFGRAFLLCGIAVGMLGQTKVDLPPPVTRNVEFTADIQPILKKRCEACHGAAQQISGLRLDQRDAALAGGYSGQVSLWPLTGDKPTFSKAIKSSGYCVAFTLDGKALISGHDNGSVVVTPITAK